MKKFFLSFVIMMAAWVGAKAMSFERAQAEALYLTDKMAYELNLNDQQYNDAYEINLDYFLRIDSPSDLYGSYYTYRLYDLRCILHDWQYSLLTAADYFLRPIIWRAGGWYFPIYSYYNRGYFYYSRPSVWVSYYGGHGRSYYRDGFYGNRRPIWNGGLRGHDMHRPAVGHNGGRRINGNGYHIDVNGRRPGGNIGSHSGGNYGGGSHVGGNHGGGVNPGNRDNHGSVGSNHSGNTHQISPREGFSASQSKGSSYDSPSRGSQRGVVSSRGNSFDSSSSRVSGSHSSGMNRGSSMGSSRSSSPSMGSSRGGGFSGGSSRGGSMGGSRGSGGSSRGGRR